MKNLLALIGLFVVVIFAAPYFLNQKTTEKSSVTAEPKTAQKQNEPKKSAQVSPNKKEQDKSNAEVQKMMAQARDAMRKQTEIAATAILREAQKVGLNTDPKTMERIAASLSTMSANFNEKQFPELKKRLMAESERLKSGATVTELQRSIDARVKQVQQAAQDAPKTIEETRKKLEATDKSFREMVQRLEQAQAAYEQTKQNVQSLTR
jgi:hypothetical protein